MFRRLAVILAVMVGGLTAVPGTAFAHGPLQSGPFLCGYQSDFYVTNDEATRYTRYVMNASGHHRGYDHSDMRRSYANEGYRSVWLTVWANDGTKLVAYIRTDGYGCQYVTVRHL